MMEDETREDIEQAVAETMAEIQGIADDLGQAYEEVAAVLVASAVAWGGARFGPQGADIMTVVVAEVGYQVMVDLGWDVSALDDGFEDLLS
jgi:hypothetical protein